MTPYFILAINPGSTSTKFAVYKRGECLMQENIRHSVEELSQFSDIPAQFPFRRQLILHAMQQNGFTPSMMHAIVGRGGLSKPVTGGTYIVNDALRHDLTIGVNGMHACNLGGLIAYDIAAPQGIPAYIVDPPVVDEMRPIARFTGLPEIEREGRFHTLNHRATGRKAAQALGKRFEDCRLIIAHMGGGISVTVHEYGRAVDTNNTLDSEGPYTPQRAGTIPIAALLRLCFSGKYTHEELRRMTVGGGGLMGYLGVDDAREVVQRIENGDAYAKLVYEGMGYQIAKEIGAYATVLKGDVDAICLTGGLAYDTYLTDYITDMVRYIAPVYIYPGEDELLALVEGALRVLDGEEEAKVYQ